MADNESQLKDDPTEETDRQPDVAYRRRPGNIAEQHTDGRQITFRSENNIELRITIQTPEIIQLKYVVEGDQPANFSYAIDPDFNPDIPEFELDEKDSHFEIKTELLRCRISKRDMQIQFYDRDENLLCEDKKPFFRHDTLMKGISEVKVTHNAPDGTSYFGLGDKTCKKGLRGNSFENWNTDSYAYERGDDPLYRSIPFYTVLNNDGRAYGIFLDNTYRSHFDFDSRGNNTCRFSADGGCMNYFFIYGPELTTVSKRYTLLTGTPELPPLWGLGYHQCRWSYFPESRVRKLAKDFRDKEIPCDAIYLDIDYMDDYRVFTWDKERFPDPSALISDLSEQGFKTIVMVDPGIKVDDDYPVYQQGLKNNYFCKRPDGELMIGPVWPPKTVFPDYTHPDVREWWAALHNELINKDGISGMWNDMNEPALFEVEKKTFPEEIRHYFDGQPASHKKAHNIYGMQMARASFEGIKKYNQNKRPFLLTRANFSGGQRFAALWTGDNIASWDHLKLANEQCQRLSISGYSFVGSDVGGFIKDPSPELFTRWLQLGLFHPLFRNHSMGYNVEGAAAVKKEEVELKKQLLDSEQEPWTFGEKYTDINRSVIELRYRLLHYLYTAFWKYVEEGAPILRPLAFADQSDEEAISRNDEFMFGDQILVSPVLDKNKRKVETYFPEGRWYDFRNNEMLKGPKTHTVDAPLDEIPFFINEGTVLPLREVMQHTRERHQQLLELNVYYSKSKTISQLYEDAGEGYGFEESDYRHTVFQLQYDPEAGKLMLTARREGTYTPAYDTIKINVIGLPFDPSAILADNRKMDFSVEDGIYTIEVNTDFGEIVIK